jgi:hypothetical protein
MQRLEEESVHPNLKRKIIRLWRCSYLCIVENHQPAGVGPTFMLCEFPKK